MSMLRCEGEKRTAVKPSSHQAEDWGTKAVVQIGTSKSELLKNFALLSDW
jgi:hypothetical protein